MAGLAAARWRSCRGRGDLLLLGFLGEGDGDTHDVVALDLLGELVDATVDGFTVLFLEPGFLLGRRAGVVAQIVLERLLLLEVGVNHHVELHAALFDVLLEHELGFERGGVLGDAGGRGGIRDFRDHLGRLGLHGNGRGRGTVTTRFLDFRSDLGVGRDGRGLAEVVGGTEGRRLEGRDGILGGGLGGGIGGEGGDTDRGEQEDQ